MSAVADEVCRRMREWVKPERPLMTAAEFGKAVGRSACWVLRQIRMGKIARSSQTGRPMIPASELRRFG